LHATYKQEPHAAKSDLGETAVTHQLYVANLWE